MSDKSKTVKRYGYEGDSITKPYKSYRLISKLQPHHYCRKCKDSMILYSNHSCINLENINLKPNSNEIIPNRVSEYFKCEKCGFEIPMLIQLKIDFLEGFGDFMRIIKNYGMNKLFAIRIRKKIRKELESLYVYNRRDCEWEKKNDI